MLTKAMRQDKAVCIELIAELTKALEQAKANGTSEGRRAYLNARSLKSAKGYLTTLLELEEMN